MLADTCTFVNDYFKIGDNMIQGIVKIRQNYRCSGCKEDGLGDTVRIETPLFNTIEELKSGGNV